MAIDLALAKQHIRVEGTDEDTLVTQYLNAAVAWVENYTGKLLSRREVTQEMAAFETYLPLFYGPSPDTLTIDYTDADDAAQTIADAKIVGQRVYPAGAWPGIADDTPVAITYTAGYATTPADLDSAVLLLVGEFYDNREAGEAAPAVTMAVEALCRPYRSLGI